MPFKVPLFIEHEPKVIGPFTFKQFVYLAVPGAVAFALYFMFPFFIFLPSAILLLSFGFALGFAKIGGRSLPVLLMNFLGFSFAPKIYIWKKGERKGKVGGETKFQITPQEQELIQQLKFKKESLVKNLATNIQTKR